ncbi:MAG: Pyruvate kinase [Chlamydiia bacterium]|nr:Pyruvate kinase [Chlamydiia bacterium]
MRKTKVICTIGPKTASKEGIKSLIDAGMDVCRLNFSHGSYKAHQEVIDSVKELRKDIQRPLAILLDTKGPEVRTRNTLDLELKEGETYVLHGESSKDGIAIAPKEVIGDLKLGDEVLFDDGLISAEIQKELDGGFEIKILTPGVLEPNKGVNFPGVKLSLPYLNKKDREDIMFGIRAGVEAIAASFAMSAEHILSIKELLRSENASNILIFAKIESLEGIHNFDEILEVSDGIMVARGDLAVECSFSQVPPMQKMMIDRCNAKGKPAIVATQMLQSMVHNAMPTRAEVSDVANSVFDGTSCAMLSSETAVGKYPAHTVSVMCEILEDAEKATRPSSHNTEKTKNILNKIASSAVKSANELNAAAIMAFSRSGQTARRIAALRSNAKVIVVTPLESTFHQTAFSFGALAMKEIGDFDYKNLDPFMSVMLENNWVQYGDLVVVTMGLPYGVSFSTNTIRIESVGDVIVRGQQMDTAFTSAHGEVTFFFPRGDRDETSFKDKIVVMREFFEECTDCLKEARAIILQNPHYDKSSEKLLEAFSQKHAVPYITRAEGAMSLLKEKEHIRLDPTLGLVFKEH